MTGDAEPSDPTPPEAGYPGIDSAAEDQPRNQVVGLERRRREPLHPDTARLRLMYGVMGLLAMTLIGGFVVAMTHHDLLEWTGFTTPIYTLAGAGLTYYFTKDHNRNS